MIEIEHLGAADGVTGSMHLVHTPQARVLLDCGLFQGRRRQSFVRNRDLRVNVEDVDVAVLSHAHIDHSGALPQLFKHGYRGAVFATPATRDLCAAMLVDGAAIQGHDAAWINRAIERDDLAMEPVEALYDEDDVTRVLEHMIGIPYRHRRPVADGVELTFLDAGHVLGSALVILDIDDEGEHRRLCFTGDLGRRNMPILRDPEIPDGVEILITETTYGDRVHPPIEIMEDELAEVIAKTVARGGKVVIPSFALERAQEVVYSLKRLFEAGRLPEGLPIYVDSPLTLKLTDVFRMHPECYDKEARAMLRTGGSPFDFDTLHYVSSVEASKSIDASDQPCVIISASGMCEFGRVVHHIKAMVEDRHSTLLIVGFQAKHTLGRRFVERRKRVKILGVERERLCEVRVLNGFSAHADQADILAFAEAVRDRGKLRHLGLVHGEDKAQIALRAEFDDRRFTGVYVPTEGERVRV